MANVHLLEGGSYMIQCLGMQHLSISRTVFGWTLTIVRERTKTESLRMCRSGAPSPRIMFATQCEYMVHGEHNSLDEPGLQPGQDSPIQLFQQPPQNRVSMRKPSAGALAHSHGGPNGSPSAGPDNFQNAGAGCASDAALAKNSDSMKAPPSDFRSPDWNGQTLGVRGIRFSQIMGEPVSEGLDDNESLDASDPSGCVVMPATSEDGVVAFDQGLCTTYNAVVDALAVHSGLALLCHRRQFHKKIGHWIL